MGKFNYLKINPGLTDILKRSKIPFSNITEITGETNNLVIFSDYSGSHVSANFETFSYYITSLENAALLSSRLLEVKQRHGIEERSMQYKSRKEKLRSKALSDWIKCVRDVPGLIITVMFDKELERSRTYIQKEKKALIGSLKAAGLEDNIEVASRISKTANFLSTIGHAIPKDCNIFWISDEDESFTGEKRSNDAMTAIGYHMDEVLRGRSRDAKTYFLSRPSGTLQRELISIPDLIAGAMAHTSGYNQEQGFFWDNTNDQETAKILHEFSQFQDVWSQGAHKSAGKIATFVVTKGPVLPFRVVQVSMYPNPV